MRAQLCTENGIKLIDTNGERISVGSISSSIKQQAQMLTGSRSVRCTVDFEFTQLIEVEACNQYGWLPVDQRITHQVWELCIDGTIFRIPSAVLISALFKPFDRLASFVHRLPLLTSMYTLQNWQHKPEVRFHLCPRKNFGLNPVTQPTALSPLLYLKYFRSAQNCFSGIATKALGGILGTSSLPVAAVNSVFHGVSLADRSVVVTSMVITKLLPHEECDSPILQLDQGALVFHSGVLAPSEKRGRVSEACILPRIDGYPEMSAPEWRKIEPLVCKGAPKKFQHKEVMDLIVKKFTYGLSWAELEGTVPLTTLKKRHQSLVAESVWNEVVRILNGSSYRTPVLYDFSG